jgi:hypothetical protein
LAWKKHEQPPPGYFPLLSDRILARLEHEETVQPASIWEWLVERFDTKPVFACAYALVISGLLLMGFSLSYAVESDLTEAPPHFSPWLAQSGAFAPDISESYLNSQPAFPLPHSPALSPETPQLLFSRGNVPFQTVIYTRER